MIDGNITIVSSKNKFFQVKASKKKKDGSINSDFIINYIIKVFKF